MFSLMIITKMHLEAMKTKVFALAAIAAVVAISCSKIGTENDYAQDRVINATIEASLEDVATRATINQETTDGPFKISWTSGDKLVVLQKRYPTTNHENAMNEFTFNGVSFDGSIVNPFAKSKWNAFFPSSQFAEFSSSANIVYATLPHEQDGTSEAFNSCYLMYRLNRSADSESPEGQEEGAELTAVNLSFDMKGFSSVIKLNVPEALNLKTISLSATDAEGNDINLAGKIKLQTAKGDNGLINGGSGKVNKGNKTTITVERSNGNIYGDVFIYLLPDAYGGDPVKYYSTAKTLNFTFINEDGLQCTLPVAIDPEHPLTAATVHDFGSLPATLPYEFDFKLGIDIENSYKLIAIEGPENIKLSPSTVYPEDGKYAEITVSAEGFASKKVGVYFKVWEFGKESDFQANASAAGAMTGSNIANAVTFETSGLVCTSPAASKMTSKDSTVEFHKGNADKASTLSFVPYFNASASLALSIASNGSRDRTMYLYYNGVEKGAYKTTTTSNVKFCADFDSVDASKTISLQPAGSGQRVNKIVWMEWGENVTAQTAAVNTEKVAGVLNFDI